MELNLEPVVIGSSHYNTLGLIRSFGEEGINPILVLVIKDDNDSHSFVTKSKYIKRCYITTEDKLIETLKQVILDKKKGIIYPSGDNVANILDQSYHLLSKNFIIPNFEGKGGNLALYNDKEAMRLRAQAYGFLTPQSWIIDDIEDLEKAKITFPVLIKAIHSQDAPKDIRIYHDLQSLYPEVLKFLEASVSVQIQTFISKDKEIIYLGWAYKDKICIPCMMEKIREYPEGFGCTGLGFFSPETSKYFDIEKLKRLIRSYGYTGLFSAEFLLFNNQTYFLEINFRNDGNGYFPGYGGVNLPLQLLLQCDGENIDETQQINSTFYMMREYSDFKWRQHTKYSFCKWIKDVRKVDVFQYWNTNDIKPFGYFLKEHMGNFLKGNIKRFLKK